MTNGFLKASKKMHVSFKLHLIFLFFGLLFVKKRCNTLRWMHLPSGKPRRCTLLRRLPQPYLRMLVYLPPCLMHIVSSTHIQLKNSLIIDVCIFLKKKNQSCWASVSAIPISEEQDSHLHSSSTVLAYLALSKVFIWLSDVCSFPAS